MLNYIEYLNIPSKLALILVGIFLILQVIGELLEFKGKVVPEYLKVRKYFTRRKSEKNDTIQTLKEVKQVLNEVYSHYSEDNISKRNDWMKWVNNKAEVYDSLVDEIGEIGKNLSGIAEALKECTKMTEETFVQNSRDRIIDFAAKIANENSVVSREEFNRIFKVYKKYESFLEEHGMSNGEVDIAYRIIEESYENHMKNHTFIEDIRGYEV